MTGGAVDYQAIRSFLPSTTIVSRSEPSGFAGRTRPPPRSRKKIRPTLASTPMRVSTWRLVNQSLLFLPFLRVARRLSRGRCRRFGCDRYRARRKCRLPRCLRRIQCCDDAEGLARDPSFPSWSAGRPTNWGSARPRRESAPRPRCRHRTTRDLVRIVRQEANPADAKLVQDRRGQAEIPVVCLKAQGMVGVDGVEAGVLQRVGL